MRRILSMLCLAFMSQAAVAQPRTLREHLDYAREHAPRVAARRAERDRARSEARRDGFWLPQAPALSGEWAERDGEEHDRLLRASIPLEPFGQAFFRAREAGAAREVALREIEAGTRAWAAEVAWLYHERIRAEWLHRTASRQASILERLAGAVQRRVETGDASELELGLARLEATEGTRRTLESERLSRGNEERLAAAIGWPAGTPLPEPDTLALVPVFPDTSGLMARALQHRPQLRLARAGRDRAAAGSRRAGAALLPDVEVGAFGGVEESQDIRGVGVELRLPFLGAPLFERGAAAAERRRQEALLRAEERDAQAEIAATLTAAALSFREVTLFREQILPGAEEARRKFQRAYEAGQVDLTTALLAEQRYRDSERLFAESLSTYLDSLRALESATGLPLLSGYDLAEEGQDSNSPRGE